MRERDKLQQAQHGGKSFVREAISAGYAAGLISFSWSPTRLREPTGDLTSLEQAIDSLAAGGSTNLAAAIRLAIEDLRAGPLRTLVLVTDGQPDDRAQALEAAHVARSAGITIIAIGTDDADSVFLGLLASASELAMPVSSDRLASGIRQAAAFLRSPRRSP